MKHLAAFLVLFLPPIALAAPTTAPASLANGQMQFTPPPDPWIFNSLADHGTAALYRSPVGHGVMLLSFVGRHAADPGREAAVRELLLQTLKENFARKNVETVTAPRAENHDRLFLETFEQWKKDGHLYSQYHLYRNLPPHQIVVTALIMSDDEREIADLRDAAETLILSAEMTRPGLKGPPPPSATRPSAEPVVTNDPATVQEQKSLADATAACLARLAKDPAYQKLQKKAVDAEATLKTLRAQDPPDRDAIATASRIWIEARSEAEGTKKSALENDPAVQRAKKALAEKRAKSQ